MAEEVLKQLARLTPEEQEALQNAVFVKTRQMGRFYFYFSESLSKILADPDVDPNGGA